jgi:CO/xanthine dehydrogenase Mo-binding subunit
MLAAWYGMDKDDIRVTTADVGGSFGAKARMYPEEMLLGFLAQKVGRPVRWTPTRSQDMTGLGHSRNQRQEVRITGKRDGTITGLDVHVITDCGAYPIAAAHMAKNTGVMLPGPLDVDQVTWRTTAVVTNTTPIVAYRGAGRPESGALLDRAVDLFASEIGVDPIEVRRKNLVPASAMPHTNPSGVVYDSGDYPLILDQLADFVGYDALRAEQAERRASGDSVHLGVGLSVFIDRTAGVAGTEYGSLQLNADGSMRVLTGSSPYGQGHYTTWSQLVSERTGVPIDRIEVVHGDTDVVPRGGITGGSRSAQKAGSAVAIATDQLVAEAAKFAADLLEAAPGDVVIDTATGQFHVAGSPAAASVGWEEIAAARTEAAKADGDDGEIAFACETDFDTEGPSVPYGAYAAVVEVDAETGAVDLRRMVSVDDAGTMINETIVRGQVHGGIGQAIGQALYEEFVYDADGNPITSNFMDYAIPGPTEMPSFESHLTETPSPNNPLGAKGIAESGTIGAVPAIQNAVVDALGHLGVRHVELPVSPQRVWEALNN